MVACIPIELPSPLFGLSIVIDEPRSIDIIISPRSRLDGIAGDER